MAKTIDDLRAFVKERMDDTSYKSEGINSWVIGCFVGIILSLISCDRLTIFNSWDKIVFFSAFILLLIVPLINLILYLDSRDLISKDRLCTSTFYPNPFIADNLAKGCLLIFIISLITIFGKNYISGKQIAACTTVASIMIGFEWAAIEFKKKMSQELFPIDIGMFIIPTIPSLAISIWILPDFTYGLDYNVVVFSLSSAAGIGLIYYCMYVFYLSPKTQLYLKLRECYKRLVSREILDVEEEEKRLQQLVSGVFFDEFFLPDLCKLSLERKQILQSCTQAYELLDFKSDYSSDAFKRVQEASNLLNDIKSKIDKLVEGSQNIKNRIDTKKAKLPQNVLDMQKVLSIQDKLETFLNEIINVLETARIVMGLCNMKTEEFTRYYKNNQDCLCKYAPYKKRFGHFIGCRVIPKIDKLFRDK